MKRILGAALAAVMFSVSCSVAASEPQSFIQGVRPLGMGGAFVALSDDQNAVFYNPAGLTQRRGGQFTLFEMPISISDDIFQFQKFYSDNKDELESFNSISDPQRKIDLINDINSNISKYRPNIGFGFPNTSFLAGNSFLSYGMGLFNHNDIGFQFNRMGGLMVPTISMWGNVDVIAAMPLAHRFNRLPFIPGSMSVGATLKYLNRARIDEKDKSVLEFEDFNPSLQWGSGFGFDLGTIYSLNERWNFGLQVTDVGGTSLKYQSVTATEEGKADLPAFVADETLAFLTDRALYDRTRQALRGVREQLGAPGASGRAANAILDTLARVSGATPA
jgi:hypothetical protein